MPIRVEWMEIDDDAKLAGVHGILRVGNDALMIPSLPEYDIPPQAQAFHRGPLLAAIYDTSATTFSPRVKQLIVSTLRRNPRYFRQLTTRLCDFGIGCAITVEAIKPTTKKRRRP